MGVFGRGRGEILPGHWDDLVVICAGTFYNGHRLADQHVADQFAAMGVPVLYVDPPVTVAGARKDDVRAAAISGPSLRLVRPNLARLTPKVPPGKSRAPVVRLADVLLRRQMVAAVSALTDRVRAVLTVAGRPVLGLCAERHKIYWARDDFAAGAKLMNLPADRVERNAARTAAASDLVIAVSPVLERHWKLRGHRTAMVPNGCDATSLAGVDRAPLPDDVRLGTPVVGMLGTLGQRIDLSLLAAVADRGHSVLLVGQRQKSLEHQHVARLLERPNVQWLGHRDYAQLPSYLRLLNVGLVPYTDSDFNRASFPLKTLEYLAAGLPVVSTSLPATSWLATDLVHVADGADAFVAAVDSALAQGCTPDLLARRREFAAQHDWSIRAAHILSLIP